MTDRSLNFESAVLTRYSTASEARQPSLCCPIQYDASLLEVLPQEIIDRDYGCGDPSKFVKVGETVLDLGSGGGKICYLASQIVGPEGSVIGVDMNDDMLQLARKYQSEIAAKIGTDNVTFKKGKIQDLSLDLELLDQYLLKNNVDSAEKWLEVDAYADTLRRGQPMIESDSVDVVLSNCVLNLVRPSDRTQLFQEVFRVLKVGGRAVISDIVSDEFVPDHLQNDPELWSGCISGAFQEQEFIREFEKAGFVAAKILTRQTEPWAVVEGIEFRSMTVQVAKPEFAPCMDHNQAVIYRGPWKSVTDDEGHVLKRGIRSAVCRRTFDLYTSSAYQNEVESVPPATSVTSNNAKPFNCHIGTERPASETKKKSNSEPLSILPGDSCCSDNSCC